MRTSNERGIALISALLIMMMISALLVGFTTMTISDQKYRFIDRDRNQSFYAAGAGLEKLTADLGNLFFVYVAPTTGQVNALTAAPPAIQNISFTKSDGTSGYQIASQYLGSTTISTGPFQGLYALITRYTMDVTARTSSGGDTHLQRQTETVAIPVFQFGIFSDVDLSFSAAADFDFGGRVHTNGNLFLAQGGSSGSTLTLADRVTAVKDVIRERLSNGVNISDTGSTRTVRVAQSPGVYRTLARTEGSLVLGPGSALNEPPPTGGSSGVSWTNISLSSYNGYIRNGRTGARALNLPLVGIGGANVDLTRRPVPNEDYDAPTLFGERLYSKASLRVLLSDTAADITTLPGVTATPPVQLDGDWNATPPSNGTTYGPISAARPPIATSPGLVTATTTNDTNAGDTEIRVVSVPVGFRIPATIGVGTNATVTCTGRTPTSFTGCTGNPAAVPAGSVVTGNVASGSGTVAVTTTTVGATAANAPTINVVRTGAFAPSVFWLSGTLVTCRGYLPDRFQSCSGVPSTSDPATVSTNALTAAGVGTVGGFIKIEKQNTAGVWTDVTMDILNWGIGGRNLSGTLCTDPTPNAILRMQRLKDNGGNCDYDPTVTLANNSTDYWPNTLFDTREALNRDFNPGTTNVTFGGVMHYIALDADNLAEWFAGQAPYNAGVTGTDAMSNNGYTVYFSDRRNNRNTYSQETGEYGWEDYVNNGVAQGVPNGTLDTGEDVNANTVLDVYGGIPNFGGVYSTVPTGAIAPFTTAARPNTQLTPAQAKVNRAILFRRALKLINGANIRDSIPGLTIASENPVYVHGDWNAVGGWSDPHAATSVIADAVTMLSSNWNDNTSYSSPWSTAGRQRSADSWYRLAIIAGKGPIFPEPSDLAGGTTFGTDGGTHSFLRFLEGNGGGEIHYRGSMATFYYNRQAVGPFKCCGGRVYDVPTRDYTFDIDFLNPALLPPNTPVFRDVNTIGFSQEIRPGR